MKGPYTLKERSLLQTLCRALRRDASRTTWRQRSDSSKTYPAAEIQSTYRAVFPSPFVHCPRKETGPLGRTKARVRLRTKALETLIPTVYTDI
ncbi:unnamed protein product [Gadus morhua 'NCC']